MKSAILATMLATATSTNWHGWSADHGKTYETHEVDAKRATWEANLEIVTRHNAEHAAGLHTYTMGMNQFADLTAEEYRTTILTPMPNGFHNSTMATEDFTAKVGAAPDAFDWRDNGNVVGAVKDQGQCGSCWAFSAVAAMEGAYNNKQGALNSFSEQEVVDCTNSGRYTCNTGGQMSDGIDEIVNNHAGKIATESDYPYTATSCSIFKNCCDATKDTVDTAITGFGAITSGDEAALKEASFAQTIISIGIDASQSSFQLYSSGVYDEPACSSTSLDHGVAIVGYGTDSGKDYWTVRNSWAASWGEDGYIRMSRNDDNQCGVATQAVYATL